QTMGVKLLSTMEPDLCSGDPSRIFIRQVLGAVAQLDRSLIVARMRVARERIRASGGRCEGAKVLGDPHYPQEKLVVENIIQLAKSGLKCSQIAETLNGSGITSRRGGKWFPSQIRRVVQRAAETV
ncbi:MAG: recombinase family protein, partial [Candidatus Sulfotelmatobacter sp.]